MGHRGVTTPGHIGCRWGDVPADQVRHRRVVLSRDRGADLGQLVKPDDAVEAHQPFNPLVVRGLAPQSQLVVMRGTP